jgi:anti-sigma B factor antagonist
MFEDFIYFCKIHPDNKETAVISLSNFILGGNDALAFTKELEALGNQNLKFVIIELTQVELMNSSGLGMLVSGISTLKKYNITMFLCNLPEKITNLLQITHLDKVFKVFPNVETALENCK